MNPTERLAGGLLGLVLLLGAAGCGTQYVYHDTITAQSSIGEDRDFLVWWSRTERRLWFDGVQGSIRLLTECSPNSVNFDEQESGIVFELRPGFDEAALDDVIGPGGACGTILDAKQIKELGEGTLRLTIRCRPLVDDEGFSTAPNPYLAGAEEPYVFQIRRTRADEFEGGAPRLECDEASP